MAKEIVMVDGDECPACGRKFTGAVWPGLGPFCWPCHGSTGDLYIQAERLEPKPGADPDRPASVERGAMALAVECSMVALAVAVIMGVLAVAVEVVCSVF